MAAPITSTQVIPMANSKPPFSDDTYFSDMTTWTDSLDYVFMGDPENIQTPRERSFLRAIRGG